MKTKLHRIQTIGLALGIASTLSPVSVLAEGESASAQGLASARLIQPIGITFTGTALNFGDMIKNALTGEVTVTLDPQAGTPSTIVSSNPSEVTLFGGHSDSIFSVTGEPNRVIQVSVTPSIIISKEGGGSAATEMVVDTFNVDAYDNAGDLSFHDDALNQFTMPADGSAGLEVGGVLHINDDDELGQYTGNFDVTVSYL